MDIASSRIVRTVLCADDDPATLGALRHILSGAGYAAITTASGFEAVCIALQDYPDLVMVDALLRDLDGYEVMRAIAKLQHGEPPPVILLGSRGRADILRARLAGAAGCVAKPITPRAVVRAITRALASRTHAARAPE